MIGEVIGLMLGAMVPLIMWFFDRRETRKKSKLEIENLALQNDSLKQERQQALEERRQALEEKTEVEQKLKFLDNILELEFINNLADAVERMFLETNADRFLILIAKNGRTDFNIVNVVFEQHKNKEFRINAISRYRNVEIDSAYKEMLKLAEAAGPIDLCTNKMDKSLLKDFYQSEGVKSSMIRHLRRKPIDEDNDFLVFSSIATHTVNEFTQIEKAVIKTQYEGTILPSLDKIITD